MTPNPKPTRVLSITTALIGNIVLFTLIIGGICTWLVTHMETVEIHEQESMRLNDMARNIGERMARTMVERYVDVRSIRDLFEQEMAQAPASQKRAVMDRTRASHQHFSWLGVVETDGVVRVGTGELLEGLSVAERNWFQGAMKEPVFFGNIHPAKLLEPHIKNPDGTPLYLLDISLPLHGADGAINGVLGSHMNWRMIQEVVQYVLGTHALVDQLSATVVSADGTILYDTRGARGRVDQVLKDLPPGGMLEAVWPSDSESSLLAAAPTPSIDTFDGMDWRVVVRLPAATVRAGIDQLRWQIIGTSLVAGLLFSLLGLFAVRSVTRPIEALVDDMSRLGETGVVSCMAANEPIAEVRHLRGAFIRMAADVARQNELLRETQFEIVRTLGRAGEFRDNETGNHVFRMSLCCARLAELAGLGEKEVELIRLASQLHDIGKIGIPDNILLKPGRFDPEERAIIEGHAEIGAHILTGLDTPLLAMARTIALTHHEKWDGSGYPRRLAGSDIPLEGRITAICDVFDALLSSRPYKQGWPIEKVVDFLQEQSGRHFDPVLTALFLEHLDDFVNIRDGLLDAPAAAEAAEAAV